MSSSASCARSSPTPQTAKTTSRRCGAAATCCASRARTRRKSPPRAPQFLENPKAPAIQAVWNRKRGSGKTGPLFCLRRFGLDVDDAEHVVGEDGESHLGSRSLEVPC